MLGVTAGRNRRALGIALLLAVACTGGPAVTETGRPRAAVVPEPAGPPLGPDGPLRGVIMASDIDRRGRPVQPAFEFPPEAGRVTAIVPVADLPAGGTLTVAWNRVTGLHERDRLFEHRIPVEPLVNAFSVGVSPGLLEEGSYEVVATLGDREVWVPWIVRPGARPTGPGGDGGGTLPAISLLASGTQAQAEEETGPPEPGDSGTESWGDEVEEQSGPCTRVEVSGHVDAFRINASATAVGDCGEVLLAARAGGSDEAVRVAQGVNVAFGVFEPCQLPGGSDVPGAVVDLGGAPVGRDDLESNDQVELEDNGSPPFAHLVTTPPSGSLVEPGQTIEWKAIAGQMPIAPGIRSLEVRGPDGVIARTPERQQRPCDEERIRTILEGTYTVPEDPPALIELSALADDFAGRAGVSSVFFSQAGQVWQGTHTTTIEGHPTTEMLAQAYVGISVAPTDIAEGALSGTGIALYPVNGVVQHFSYGCEIAGRREGQFLELEVHACWTKPAGVPWTVGAIQIPISGNTASRTWSMAYSETEIKLRCVSGC